LKFFTPMLACLGLLTACASGGTSGDGGGMLGLAPSALSSGAAAMLGNLGGRPTTKDLDDKDKSLSSEAITSALQVGEVGKSTAWRNPQTGHSGQITPGPVYSVNDYACRDYVHAIVIGERQETVRASACRQPDGTWRALL
jgi:surface antigen